MAKLLARTETGIDLQRLTAFASRYYCEEPDRLRLRLHKLRGGLSAYVVRVHVSFLNPDRRPRRAIFVLKCIAGSDLRELGAYRSLSKGSFARFAPKLLGSETAGAAGAYLYLEYIPPLNPWPWADPGASELVLDRLAALHESPAPGDLPCWDYESELGKSASSTLETVEEAACLDEFAAVRRFLPSVRRLVAALPSVRSQLVGGAWPRTVLHGDAHTGNAIIRREGRSHSAVLLDWGRIRLGSALEDVCSWLQSLSFWEPEPKRRHDTLLRKYLAGRGMSDELSPELRERYWLAGASNAFAGALRYHVLEMGSACNSRPARTAAAAAVRDWLRILARADACWSI